MSQGSYLRGERFHREIYCKGAAGVGSLSGASYADAKPIASGDLMNIPAGLIIEEVLVIIDTAITGTTVAKVGDDDDDDGFVPDFAASFATPGLYNQNAKVAGAYLRTETAGATDAADVYVVPNRKYYSAAGKEVKLACSTANTAGAFRVIVRGYFTRPSSY